MAPLILEGDTLGTKHRNYNNFFKEVISGKETLQITDICLDGSDVENLMKIDVASYQRNVEYILKVLKCEDMLYVSKAINKSTWLITDPQYEYIINPEYLELQLFPEMMSKAIIKFMLQIRLKLKDEKRVEKFYNWVADKNIKNAVKWLPNCSVPFIEKMVEKHADVLDMTLFKRLCERSFTILEIYNNSYDKYKKRIRQIELANFFIHTHPEKYLDIVDKLIESVHFVFRKNDCPKFGKRTTDFVLKTCPRRIIDNFEKYCDVIHLKTFSKHMKRQNIKEFLLREAEKATNGNSIQQLRFNKIKYLIEVMPIKERFEFVKEVFIDKSHIKSDSDQIPLNPYETLLNKLYTAVNFNCIQHVYRWYQFAPFDIAFEELVKMISSEKSQETKYDMLNILINVGGMNLQDTKILLKYYCDKHLQDDLTLKVQFLNNLLSFYNIHKYDEECWNYLNKVFHNVGIYEKSQSDLQNCIVSIIIYEVVHNHSIPDTIDTNVNVSYIKPYSDKLNQVHKDLVFIYFYEKIVNKLDNPINNKIEFEEKISSVKDALKLLSICKKDLIDYPILLKKIKDFINLKKSNDWANNLSDLYNFKKSWRKHMFNESIALCPSENVCLNVLKHNSNLLMQYETELEALSCNDKISLHRFLHKLRIYWGNSLTEYWIVLYNKNIDRVNIHKSVTRGLFALLTKQPVNDIVQKYSPVETKINWENIDEISLSLSRYIAKTLHIARPQPPPELILLYAKGDYLQYALPSLHAIFYNLCLNRSLEYIPKLLDAPVSLQKNGIRFAFDKMTTNDLKDMFSRFWKSSKNLSIRAVIFKLTHKYLCKEINNDKINDMWQLLDFLMDNLTNDEDKSIYETLLKVENIHMSVRGKFLKKSFKFLKQLTETGNKKFEDYTRSIQNLARYTENIMESVDADFIVDILMEFINASFIKENADDWIPQVISKYIFFAKHEETQKIDNLVSPLMVRLLDLWDTKAFVKDNFDRLVWKLQCSVYEQINHRKLPMQVLLFILKKLEVLPVQENYVLIRKWKIIVTLASTYNNLFNTELKDDLNIEQQDIDVKAAPELGRQYSKFLKEDIKSYFPCIYILFIKALDPVYSRFPQDAQTIICSSLVEDEQFIEGFLCAIKIFPVNGRRNEKIKEVLNIIKSHPSVEVRMHYYNRYNNTLFGTGDD